MPSLIGSIMVIAQTLTNLVCLFYYGDNGLVFLGTFGLSKDGICLLGFGNKGFWFGVVNLKGFSWFLRVCTGSSWHLAYSIAFKRVLGYKALIKDFNNPPTKLPRKWPSGNRILYQQ